MDVTAFLIYLGIPSPISKMGVGFKENGGGRRGTACVWEGGWTGRWTCVVRWAPSLGPVWGLHSEAGLCLVRGGLMAQALHSPCHLLTPPYHRLLCESSYQAPWSFHPGCHPSSPSLFQFFCNSPARLSAAYPHPRSKCVPGARLDQAGGRCQVRLGSSRRTPCPYLWPLGALLTRPPDGWVADASCNLWSKSGQRRKT